ncbi:MAG: hypothetical protein IPF81_04115 [Bacteroidetes bacterium]|nr:hypothetical protein [Bacteroidota bacterium]
MESPFTRFSTKDGLVNSDVWTIVEDIDGNIWVGTSGDCFVIIRLQECLSIIPKMNRQ